MSHLRTVHIEPPSISHRRAIHPCRSVEDLSPRPVFKAEKTVELQGRLTSNRTILAFSELGILRFVGKNQEQRKEKEAEEQPTERENSETTKQGLEDNKKSWLLGSVVKRNMSLAEGDVASSASEVKDLQDAQDANAKLNEMLQRENRVSEAKEITIKNLRHEISVLDQELAEERKANNKNNEEMRKLRSKTTALQTENRILERQVNTINESNKKLHNELHELRNTVRTQETEVGELRVQKSDAVRKYAHLVQTSIEQSTRWRFILRQLKNDIATHDVTAKKFEIQVQALEDLIQEHSQEDLQFKKYGLLSPRKMRKTALSEEEKLSLRRDLEGALGNNRKFSEKNFPIEKLVTATERHLAECLRARIGRENEESSRIDKLVQEVKHEIKGLVRLEVSHVEASKIMDDRVGLQLAAVEQLHEELSEDLRLAQSLKLENEEKLKSIRKSSIADSKVEGLSLNRRASQAEKLDLESSISKLERKTEEANNPLTEEERDIFSLQQKLASTTEEKLFLYDELIETQTAFKHLEALLESRRLENEKMEKELSDKEKTISQAEESLGEANNEMTLLKQKLDITNNELGKRLSELEELEGKLKDRAHRVELNFTPNKPKTRQSNLVQAVENASEEFCSVGNTSTAEFTNKTIVTGIDKEVQTGEEFCGNAGKPRRESLAGIRRRYSVDQIDGRFKLERRISKAELKLVHRVDKGVQTGNSTRELDEPKTRDHFNNSEDLRNSDENRDLRAVMEKEQREIEIILEAEKCNEMESLENSLTDLIQERDSVLAAKDEAIDRVRVDVDRSRMDARKHILDWQQKSTMEEDFEDVKDKLKEAELEALRSKEKEKKAERNLKVATERMTNLQKELSDARSTVKEKEENIGKLNARNSELQSLVHQQEQSLFREEKLRMENMKTLDGLKIKMEKMERDERKEKERLFSLKSACSEANEAYEIVKKQNHELKHDMEQLKKKLSETDYALEASQKEKEKMQEEILNASRTIDDWRKNSRRDDSLSPDSALGISLTSTSDMFSAPNSPNSDISDNAFSTDGSDVKFGQETGLLCKMPTMVGNLRAVVQDNEVLRAKLYEVGFLKEKLDNQVKHLSELNEILKKDVSLKEKSMSGLEDKVKELENDWRTSKGKVVELERNVAVVSREAELLNSTLETREKDIAELKETVELQEEKEKTLELYSKSVAEKFEHEASEKRKFEELYHRLLNENSLQKEQLENIHKKLNVLSSNQDDAYVPAGQDCAAMATVEEKVGVLLKNIENLKALNSNLEDELADLQLANGDLQRYTDRFMESDKVKRELEEELKITRLRDEENNAKLRNLGQQKEVLQNENKSMEAAIMEHEKKEGNLEAKAQALQDTVQKLEEANRSFRAETDDLKENVRQVDEENSKLASELKSFRAKMSEIETTNATYEAENEKLRTDILALTEAKCNVELKISEAERMIKKLNETVEKERTERETTEAERKKALSDSEELQSEITKAKTNIVMMEEKQKQAEKSMSDMEKSILDTSTENKRLADELAMVKKDFCEMEERYKNSIQEEENLQQKLNLASLELTKLTTAYEGSVKRHSALEKSCVESKAKNEELDMLVEKTRTEKTNLLKEINHKEEIVHQLEAERKELQEERQRLTNDLYVATRKVLSQQKNLETVINEMNLLHRDVKGLAKNAFNKEWSRHDDGRLPREGEESSRFIDNEALMHDLRHSIRATERNLDLVRPEARILEHETKSCQRDVEFVDKEFAFLRNQLSVYSSMSHKLCDELMKLKGELAQKEAILEETNEQLSNLKVENLENRESIIHFQGKCAELEALFGEYESKAEKTHAELLRANQQISTLEANLTRAEQKKVSLEKELLVSQEKNSNLEAAIRAMKDEARKDQKKIATLETEFSEKQALGRELVNTESALRDLRVKFDDVLKEKEETKSEAYAAREEARQQQVELKNSRKEIDNLKKQITSEKGARVKVEEDLNENITACKTYKKYLQDLERSVAKLREENSDLEEKVALLDTSGNTLKKETGLQAIEMKRLKDELREVTDQYSTASINHEASEKEKKRLSNELIVAEENISKLHGACEELLKEKEASSGKVLSMNETIELMISSHEETVANLKQDLMITKKELSVSKSALERRQKQVDDLQEEVQNDELKIKSLEEKKQDVLEKFWASQNELTDADAKLDSLCSENKELKERIAASTQRGQHLQDTLQSERETNEKEVTAWSDQMNKLKTLHKKVIQERDDYKKDLENAQDSLTRTVEDLKQTKNVLNDKEKTFNDDVAVRDRGLEDLSHQNTRLINELNKTTDALKTACVVNDDLKERLEIAQEKVEVLEKTLQERNAEVEDLLAEAQAKLNVVHKMRVTNSGENFASLPLTGFAVKEEDEEWANGVGTGLTSPRTSSMKDVVVFFHKACLDAFENNRALQQDLNAKTEESVRLEDSLNKEQNNLSEVKRYLHDVEKKKGRLEEEAKRLRKRLEVLKQKSLEMEKEKDNKIMETNGEKLLLEKDLWEMKEALEESKAKRKSTEEENERYRKELESSRMQIVEAESDITQSQQRLDVLQEKILQLKKRIFELEANDKTCQQLIYDKDKELSTNKSKIEELERLCNAANEKKTELFAKLARADERTVSLEKDYQERIIDNATLESEIALLKDSVGEKDKRLESTAEDLRNINKRCEELKIQRESLQVANDVLNQQLDASRKECFLYEPLLQKEKLLSDSFSKQLEDVTQEKGNLELELKEMLQQKENFQQLLNKSEDNLKEADNSVINLFQEIETLKRQMVKERSSACADSARKQLEIGKLKAESEALKKELNEKEKENSETVTRCKVTEKENEFLKKDLAEKHERQSELKFDLTSTNSKLQSYVIERECWEREVKSVLSEMEQQKNSSHTKEERLERLRARYENEIRFLQQRIEALEREVRVIQEASEQQRHADEIASKLALECKEMEIDNLKLRLQATKIHGSQRGNVLQIVKEQLDDRTRQIADLMEQLRVLKESYHLELGSLHADLKCAQMENMLQTAGGGRLGNESELVEAIKQCRGEGERLRTLLQNKMEEMKSLRKLILSERVVGGGVRQPGYRLH